MYQRACTYLSANRSAGVRLAWLRRSCVLLISVALVSSAASATGDDRNIEDDFGPDFPTLDARRPTIEYRRPLVEPRTPNIQTREPNLDYRQPNVEFRRPSIERAPVLRGPQVTE